MTQENAQKKLAILQAIKLVMRLGVSPYELRAAAWAIDFAVVASESSEDGEKHTAAKVMMENFHAIMEDSGDYARDEFDEIKTVGLIMGVWTLEELINIGAAPNGLMYKAQEQDTDGSWQDMIETATEETAMNIAASVSKKHNVKTRVVSVYQGKGKADGIPRAHVIKEYKP